MTTRPSANVNPIISRLTTNQMWIIMEENLKLVLLFDLKNLGLLGSINVSP
jgi:hypothetical protein